MSLMYEDAARQPDQEPGCLISDPDALHLGAGPLGRNSGIRDDDFFHSRQNGHVPRLVLQWMRWRSVTSQRI